MPRSHKTLPRLFVDFPLAEGETAVLGREHSNYLANALRRRLGDKVVLFNGRDGAFQADLTEVSRKAVRISIVAQIAAQTPPSDLWYGFAPLKSARLDYMVQKATEMGVGQIQPIITRHTQLTRVKPEKMRANVIEAAEQCEVLSIPAVLEDVSLENLITNWNENHGDRALLLADESAASASPVATLKCLEGQKIGVLIGPEGGFSDDELSHLKSQQFVTPISLGPRILRADTAAVAALAIVQSCIGDWR